MMAHHRQNPNRPFRHIAKIKDQGFFVRRQSNNVREVCCQLFEETPDRGEPIPQVDEGYIGVTAQPPEAQRPLPKPVPWYLTIRSYLKFTRNLNRHGTPGCPQYLYDHCCHARDPNVLDATGLNANDSNQATREYGSHLYVDYCGTLCVTDIYKRERIHTRFDIPQQYSVNDVLPKYRLYYGSTVNRWEFIDIAAVFVFEKPWELDGEKPCTYIRWWDRTGRLAKSRFFETFAHIRAYQLLMERMLLPSNHNRNYFGVYVSGSARLIMFDTELPGGQHNRTLVLGGSFIVVNALFHIAFMDNVICSRTMPQLLSIPALGLPSNTPRDHLIVVLKAVPSLADTICWGLDIQHHSYLLMGCLKVPLHGWRIPERIQFLPWNAGLTLIAQWQQNIWTNNRQREFINTRPRRPNEYVERRTATFDDPTVERQYWPHEMFRRQELDALRRAAGRGAAGRGSGGAGGSGSGTGTKRPASGSGGGSAKRFAT